MPLSVRGLGSPIPANSLQPGDLYVERGNGHSLLVLAGPASDDPLDLILAVKGDYFNDTKPPYQTYRSGVSGNVVRVTGDVEILPLEGDTPFLQDYVAYGTLGLDVEGTPFARLKVGTWVSLATGEQVNKPKTVAEYDRWRLAWRDGDVSVTLASFGAPPPKKPESVTPA